MATNKYGITIDISEPLIFSRGAKKRLPGGGKKDGSIKAGKNYGFQYSHLIYCLQKLVTDLEEMPSSSELFLEAIFFPDKVSDEYYSELEGLAGIKIIRHSIISSNTVSNAIYFKINSRDQLLSYITFSLGELGDYTANNNDSVFTRNKRIILWKEFKLISVQNKYDRLTRRSGFTRFHIEFLGTYDKQILVNSLNEFNLSEICTISEKDGSDVFGDVEVDFTDADNNIGINEWLANIASNSSIGAIRLDHFMSSTENILNGGITKELDVVINIPKTLPVVAVIDSGIQENTLTRDLICTDGLDFTQDNPISGNPYIDNLGHGTGVGCAIAYGNRIKEYFLRENEPEKIDPLIPVCKLFSVRVFKDKHTERVPYDKIFEIGGIFGEKIKEHNIKLINISFGSIKSASVLNFDFSEESRLIDAFSSYYDVLCVVSAGNISKEDLVELNTRYPTLQFLSDKKKEAEARMNFPEHININSPSELISGISVGSLIGGHPAFHSRSFPKIGRGLQGKPDILSIGGGDYKIDEYGTIVGEDPEYIIGTDPSLLIKVIGTSFSTPIITRVLALGISTYGNITAPALKALLLHKVSQVKAKNVYKVNTHKFSFNESFLGQGVYNTDSEVNVLYDGDNEVTFLKEGKISRNQVIGFNIDIRKFLASSQIPKDNRIKLSLTLCTMPIAKLVGGRKDNNIMHCSSAVHRHGISPIKEPYTEIKNGVEKTFENQMITSQDSNILLPWTADYYSNSNANSTYTTSSKTFTKEVLLEFLGKGDTVTISIRGLSDSPAETKYGVVFSLEDEGGTAALRNYATATANIKN